ncbi:MAG: Xaa-Pro dipeptidase [Gammaproteobacteria bacterium]|nr:Xaa-Pro dipeptidase [Gammaproteobacteria bacterium]
MVVSDPNRKTSPRPWSAVQVNPRHADADALFADHLDIQLSRYFEAMESCHHDALVIAAGAAAMHFLDDMPVSFKPNPHFRLLTPLDPAEGSSIVLRPGRQPVLLHLRPRDFWHLPPEPAAGSWTAGFEIREFSSPEALQQARDDLIRGANAAAFIDPAAPVPVSLLAHLDYGRARKTPYEIACLAQANRRAAKGHRAARDAFRAGAPEFAIHMAYLAASSQEDADLPYGNIIALNEHAAVLHYQHRQRELPPGGGRSFLIDAGATERGYAADVTRTYSAEPGPFADLISALDTAQRDLVAGMVAGMDFVELHRAAHLAVGRILIDAGIAKGDADSLLESGVTGTFLPHGLGHLIGVQTHDVGGRLADAEGSLRPPPESFPALRLTRTLTEDVVVTIEPGLYFIPMLLEELRRSGEAGRIDWSTVNALIPFGGIRIEDNVQVTASGSVNLTRPALAAEGLA